MNIIDFDIDSWYFLFLIWIVRDMWLYICELYAQVIDEHDIK